METKKISFGFMKTKKQEKPVTEEKKEYIDCVEEKSIKVVGGETVKEDKPLIIPMKPNTLITAERLIEIAEKVEGSLEEIDPAVKQEKPIDEILPENETLEQMAARELLQEAKKQKVVEQPNLIVAIPAKPVMDGEKESTLNDYESVPIQEFGLAMLRGMGWQPGQEQSKHKQPQLRPKGLGLGADKMVTEKKKKMSKDKNEEELGIVKGSFVKVTTGKYNGCYGKVISLDEDNGRVLVDMAVKKETVNLSEFMMQAVTKSEYEKQSKVINADSFAEYKENELVGKQLSKHHNSTATEESTSRELSNRNSTREREKKKDEYSKETREDDKFANGRNKERVKSQRSRNNSTSDDERTKSKHKDRTYSNKIDADLSSDSDKKDHRRKNRHSSTSSDSSSTDYRKRHKSKSNKSSKQKRDIDKKRKGKKKRRDRDRSPNYRKHKK